MSGLERKEVEMDNRMTVAAMMLQKRLPPLASTTCAGDYARDAVVFADALLARLAETPPEADDTEVHESALAYAAADRLIDAEEQKEVPAPEPVKRADTGWQLTIVPRDGHEWIAQDKDGEWCFFTHMPDFLEECWNATGGFYGETARHAPYPGPWTKALFRLVNNEWVRWDHENNRPAGTPQPKADGVELSEAVMAAIDNALGHSAGLVDIFQKMNIARAVIAADRAERPVVVPEGWAIVPATEEGITEDMANEGLDAGFTAYTGTYTVDPVEAYLAMVAASPSYKG